jgi:hypothetical protein
VVAQGAREGDVDPYLGWHEARSCGKESGVERRRPGHLLLGWGGSGGEGRRSAKRRWCAIKRRLVMENEARGSTPSDEGK